MTRNSTVLILDEKEDFTEIFLKDRLSGFLRRLKFGLNEKYIEIDEIVDTIALGLPSTVTKSQLYDITAETIASKVIYHPDYSLLAGRVEAHRIQQLVEQRFSDNIITLRNHKNKLTNKQTSFISDRFYKLVMSNREAFDKIIVPARDFDLSYFGLKTLQKSYLLHRDTVVSETPQYLFLRVAIEIHEHDISKVSETYNLLSERYFIHASPTLFNAGNKYNFLSSCFLIAMEDDSIDGIYKTLYKTALISKASGGIGLHVHNIRASGSFISSSNGMSSGLVPMLRVFNNTARYVDQGGNKRPGAFAIYLEPWHSDVFEFLDLRKNHGKEEMRARDLFYGLWIPDLFMKRVKEDGEWSLFSPDQAPGLSDVYGEKFESLYQKYENENIAVRTVKAQKLWLAILESQIETGGPFMLYKDACNKKSNQKNLGTIKSSNLCCEVMEYSSPEETAVCNLGSLGLPKFIKYEDRNNETFVTFDFKKLHSVTKVLVENLDKIIDRTSYPIESAEKSNKRHRPLAVGVQGLADLFFELRIPFDSLAAKKLNIQIFETIYHAAIEMSLELSIKRGPYNSFESSPSSKGLLQFDLWSHQPSSLYNDWDKLKKDIKVHGLRNSLLVAPMPTASTSQILGFSECFEPYTSNIYNRRVLSGEFQIVNKYLLNDLIDLGLWNSTMRNKIILEEGSIQNIAEIPDSLKNLYKTVWEISQKVIIDLAADRGKFIDQSQSMNIYLKNPTLGKLTSCHFYAWEKGLKTGMYYLRTQAAAKPIQFTLDLENLKRVEEMSPISTKVMNRKRYLETSTDDNDNDKVKNIKMMKKNDEEETIDIFDSRPVSCSIDLPNNCDSCSG